MLSFDNRQSRIDPYFEEEEYDPMAAYDAYGRLRNLQAEMEASYRRLCDRCGWSPDGMSKADANLENFYAGGL